MPVQIEEARTIDLWSISMVLRLMSLDPVCCVPSRFRVPVGTHCDCRMRRLHHRVYPNPVSEVHREGLDVAQYLTSVEDITDSN
jgi:hypothetical protein